MWLFSSFPCGCSKTHRTGGERWIPTFPHLWAARLLFNIHMKLMEEILHWFRVNYMS